MTKYKAYAISLFDEIKYIGITTRSIKSRWNQHRHPKSPCVLVRRAMRKYGENSFSIEHIASSWNLENLQELERLLIEQHQTFGGGGYNLTSGGGVGLVMSDEVRARMSVGSKLSHSTPQARKKMSDSAKRRFATQQAREAHSLSQRARWTPEAKAAQAERARKQMADPSRREFQRQVMLRWSPEKRAANGKKVSERLSDPVARAQHAQRIKEAHARPEVKARLSAGQRARYAEDMQA